MFGPIFGKGLNFRFLGSIQKTQFSVFGVNSENSIFGFGLFFGNNEIVNLNFGSSLFQENSFDVLGRISRNYFLHQIEPIYTAGGPGFCKNQVVINWSFSCVKMRYFRPCNLYDFRRSSFSMTRSIC